MNKASTVTTHVRASESVDTQVRVSLREVREASYRALSALGASHGEAAIAARMVLEAEFKGLGGVEALIRDVSRGPWLRESVKLVAPSGSDTVIRLGAAATNRLLRHGPLAVDLAASELDSDGVFIGGAVLGMPCLDAVLLEVAGARGCSMGAVAVHGRSEGLVRIAHDDGSLGSGTVVDDSSLGDIDDAEQGVWVCAPARQRWELADLTWIDAAQRDHARAVAAREGCWVDAAQWGSIYAASRRYLVG